MSYDVNKTGAINYVGTKTTYFEGLYTTTRTRWFTVIDLTGSGLSLGEIISVKFRINVVSVVSATTYRLRSTDIFLTSWQNSLDATESDFVSTVDNIEDDIYISSTGWKEFNVDKNNLNLNGKTWFRITCMTEGGAYAQIGLNTQNSSSNKPHLRIETITTNLTLRLNPLINPNINGGIN